MTIRPQSDFSLKGRITKIDEVGLATIKFTKKLVKVENITLIDDRVLNISVNTSYSKDFRDLNLTWKVVFMQDKDMKI